MYFSPPYRHDSLDWTYSPVHKILTVDEYEKRRSPRQHSELIMSPYKRYKLLLNTLEIPMNLILEVTAELKLIRESRQRTADKFLKKSKNERFRVAYQSIKKMFTFKKRKRKGSNAQTRHNEIVLCMFKTVKEPLDQNEEISVVKDKHKLPRKVYHQNYT